MNLCIILHIKTYSSFCVCNTSQEFFQMLSIWDLGDLTLIEFIMCDDVVHVWFILSSCWIKKSNSYGWFTESTTSTNSMKIGGSRCLHLSFNFIAWDVKIDNKFSFWNINTSRYQISTYQSMNFLFSEICHGGISLFFRKSREHNMRSKTVFLQFLVNARSKVFTINKDICLCCFASLEDFLNEF